MIDDSQPQELSIKGHEAANICASDIDGWMSIRELQWLSKIASDCELIIEVGSYKGRSSKALADNCIGRVYCIDPWDGFYYNDDGSINKGIKTKVSDQFYNNLSNHIKSGRVIPLTGYGRDFKFAPEADLVFIDGDHRYNEVIDDIARARSWIRNGGIISGHDYNQHGWPGVKRAVDESFENVKVVDTIWYVQILK